MEVASEGREAGARMGGRLDKQRQPCRATASGCLGIIAACKRRKRSPRSELSGSPSTSLGRSEATLGSTATRTTGLHSGAGGGKAAKQWAGAGGGRGEQRTATARGQPVQPSASPPPQQQPPLLQPPLLLPPLLLLPCWPHLTENFMALMVCASSLFSSHSVAFLVMNWSRPTRATVLPAGGGAGWVE